jgi:hypothetical protein
MQRRAGGKEQADVHSSSGIPTENAIFNLPAGKGFSIWKMHIYMGNTWGGQNNGNITKMKKRICVGYTERTSVANTQCSSSFILCSAPVSALVTVLSDSVRNNRKMGDFVRFSKRAFDWRAFSCSICDKN